MKKLTLGLVLLVLFVNSSYSKENTDDEWYGFDYKEAGISASEFDMVKEKGMSREELLELLEIGIMPSEYFDEPWKKLGVSKSHWIKQKKQGMEDADIDKNIYTRAKFNHYPLVSFFLPGYYAYKTKRYKAGATMTGIFAAGVALTFLSPSTDAKSSDGKSETKKINPIFPMIAVMACVWSATDAYLGTRFSHNSDAARFSFVPLIDSSPGAQVLLKF